MNQTLADRPNGRPTEGEDRPRVERLATTLIEEAQGSGDARTGISNLVRRARSLSRAAGIAILRNNEGRWSIDRQHVQPTHWADAMDQLAPLCQLSAEALRRGHSQVVQFDGSSGDCGIAVPLVTDKTQKVVLAARFRGRPSPPDLQRRLYTLQLLAPLLTQLELRCGPGSDVSSRIDRALVETVIRTEANAPLRPAIQHAVDRLTRLIPVQQVFLARGRKSLRLEYISGSIRFDPHSEVSRLAVSLMEQGMLSTLASLSPQWVSLTEFPAAAQLRQLLNQPHQWLVVWRPTENSPASALLMASSQPAPDGQTELLEGPERYLTTLTRLIELHTGGARQGWLPWSAWWARQSSGARRLLVVAAAVAIGILLAIPVPYRVRARATLQPMQHRYVAAPYEGRLEATFVKPGDVVAEGQLLARMDGRELEWNLSGLRADWERARKQRDAAMADRETSSAQMARLEMERLGLKIQLLEDQAANLEIKSPMRGIVVSGDPQKIEGARVAMGQTIVEIAPLESMLVEVQIPDREIHQVTDGDRVSIRLEAVAHQALHGQLSRIHPRAEQRDGHNVFIGLVEMNNEQGELRPGMSGKATISGARRCLAWNLFRPVWDQLRYWLTW